jgi:hypothetical protein
VNRVKMRFGWHSASQEQLQRTAFVYTLLDGSEALVTEVTRSASEKPKFADSVAVGVLKSFVRTRAHGTSDSAISVITVSPDARTYTADGATDKRKVEASDAPARRRAGAADSDLDGVRQADDEEDGHDAAKRALAVLPRTHARKLISAAMFVTLLVALYSWGQWN